MDPTHRSLSYPLAYSFVVLPTSITRWLEFSNKNVPSAATFFGVILFNLSGAINVLLFLIFKPELLLFSRPDQLTQPDHELVQVVSAGNDSGILMDAQNIQHSPESTTKVLAGDSDGTGLSRVNSKRTLDDII